MTAMVWLMLISRSSRRRRCSLPLAVFLLLILRDSKPIGGIGISFLAKIRLGLRAIEVETGHIPRQVTKLNVGLSAVRDGLDRRRRQPGAACERHVQRQEGR